MLGCWHSLNPGPCLLLVSVIASGIIRIRLGRAEPQLPVAQRRGKKTLAQTSQRTLRKERPSSRGCLPLSYLSSQLVLKGSGVPRPVDHSPGAELGGGRWKLLFPRNLLLMSCLFPGSFSSFMVLNFPFLVPWGSASLWNSFF